MIFIKIMRRYTFGPRSEKYVRFINTIKLIEKINLKSIKTDVVLKHDSYLKKKNKDWSIVFSTSNRKLQNNYH